MLVAMLDDIPLSETSLVPFYFSPSRVQSKMPRLSILLHSLSISLANVDFPGLPVSAPPLSGIPYVYPTN